MSETVVQVIIGIAGSSLITSILAFFFNKNKTKAETEQVSADAAQKIREAATGMVQEFRLDNSELRERNDALEEERREMRRTIERKDDFIGDARRAMTQTGRIIAEKGLDLRDFPQLREMLDRIQNK